MHQQRQRGGAPCSRATRPSRRSRICSDRFGFDKPICAVSLAEWAGLISRNLFPVADGGGKFSHAAWLGAAPSHAAVAGLKALAINGDGFLIIARVGYISTPHGFSNSKLAARFDRASGAPNTARNWKRVLKLDALARQSES